MVSVTHWGSWNVFPWRRGMSAPSFDPTHVWTGVRGAWGAFLCPGEDHLSSSLHITWVEVERVLWGSRKSLAPSLAPSAPSTPHITSTLCLPGDIGADPCLPGSLQSSPRASIAVCLRSRSVSGTKQVLKKHLVNEWVNEWMNKWTNKWTRI